MVLLGGLLLLWQLPHFWSFALRHWADLQRAGLFPDLPLQPAGPLRGLIFLWTFALTVATLLLPTLGVLPRWPTALLCLVFWIGPLRRWWSLRAASAAPETITPATAIDL